MMNFNYYISPDILCKGKKNLLKSKIKKIYNKYTNRVLLNLMQVDIFITIFQKVIDLYIINYFPIISKLSGSIKECLNS